MDHADHILVVDDDADIRGMVADYLKKNGLRATTAADGREMRAVLERSVVDLIVLDLMMPGEDGLTLARDLRAGKHRAIPVVMLTARDDQTDRIIGLEMGADDYVTKPFAARELLARIKAVIRRTRMLPPNLQVTEASAAGSWIPPRATCSTRRGPWSRSAARNSACCACSWTIPTACSAATTC